MTNYFRKIIFMYFLNSAFICCLFCPIFKPNNLLSPVKEPVIYQEVYMNLDFSFSCYLLSVLTLNKFVLRKHRLVFELCDYFNFFLSFSGAVSIKTRRKQLFVGYKLISVTVLCSTIGLFVLIPRLDIF